jgi:hypothetical protein
METFANIITLLINLSLELKQLGAEKRQEKQAILSAISKAFYATENYYRMLENGGARDNQKECDVAGQWECASLLIEPIDSDLAKRLGLKSNFWRGGAAWSGQEISTAGIQLDRVRAEGMTLFNQNKK